MRERVAALRPYYSTAARKRVVLPTSRVCPLLASTALDVGRCALLVPDLHMVKVAHVRVQWVKIGADLVCQQCHVSHA